MFKADDTNICILYYYIETAIAYAELTIFILINLLFLVYMLIVLHIQCQNSENYPR